MHNIENSGIEKYATSLLKWNIYDSYEESLKESKRWHNKAANGLVEPLKCPYDPNTEISTIYNDGSKRIELIEFKTK